MPVQPAAFFDEVEVSPNLAAEYGVEGNWRFGQLRICDWSDLDGLGHVNNARYIEWCQEARIRHFRAAYGDWPGKSEVNLIVRKLEFTFDKALGMGEQLLVTVRMREMRGTSFVQEYAVWSGGLVGSGMAVCVTLDSVSKEKTLIPEGIRRCFDRYETGVVNLPQQLA